MEDSLNTFRLNVNVSERQKLLEKRLISITNQINWLEKIKRTLERQIIEEKQKNY